MSFFLISILRSIFIGAPHMFLQVLGEFIPAAYCFIKKFVIVLVYFSHQSGIIALWLRGCFSTCLNDGDTYEDGILEWS